jgi:hypothetical protein
MATAEAAAATLISTPTAVSGGLVRQSRATASAAPDGGENGTTSAGEIMGFSFDVAIVNIRILRNVDNVNIMI